MSAAIETKPFPTADVLSAVTDRLVSPNGIGGVYEVLSYMAGEDVFTHQLPRIGREAAPAVLKLHPELAAAYEEAKQVNQDNWREWLAAWEGRYGATLTVPRMSLDEHERIDPLSELVDKVSPDKIVLVHPMTTETTDAALCERLRTHREMRNYGNGDVRDEPDDDCEEAASRIEALGKEVDRRDDLLRRSRHWFDKAVIILKNRDQDAREAALLSALKVMRDDLDVVLGGSDAEG